MQKSRQEQESEEERSWHGHGNGKRNREEGFCFALEWSLKLGLNGSICNGREGEGEKRALNEDGKTFVKENMQVFGV